MFFAFARPHYLWLLILILPLALLHMRYRGAGGGSRNLLTAMARLTALALLIGALAGPSVQWSDSVRTVVAVVDVSSSVRDEDLVRSGEVLAQTIRDTEGEADVKLVLFDASARQVEITDDLVSGDGILKFRNKAQSGPGSAIGEALALAGGLIRHDGRGEVILLSDGLETSGDARNEACRLGQRGIVVKTTPLGQRRDREVLLLTASLPPVASVGQTVQVQAQIESSVKTPARLIFRDLDVKTGKEVAKNVTLTPGVQTVSCDFPLDEQGLRQYEVRLEVQAAADTLAENNLLSGAIFVHPPRDVRVVETTSDMEDIKNRPESQ